MIISGTTPARHPVVRYWQALNHALGLLQPAVLLLFRVFVAVAFWRAGVVKLDDPVGTLSLFTHEYVAGNPSR